MLRKVSVILILLSVVGMVSHAMGGALPSLRWFFEVNETFGYVCMALACVAGVALLLSGKRDIEWKPMTLRKFQRFKSMRRGYVSFLILMVLVVLAMLDQTLVGKRALVVKYEGRYYFPAFSQKQYPGKEFGLGGESEADYRELGKMWEDDHSGNWLLMPVIPWDPVLDSQELIRKPLVQGEDGLYRLEGSSTPYSGIAYTYYREKPGQVHSMLKFRKGKRSLRNEGYTIEGNRAVVEQWDMGTRVSRKFYEGVDREAFEKAAVTAVTPVEKTLYPALAPTFKHKHYLGTNSQGWDIVATLLSRDEQPGVGYCGDVVRRVPGGAEGGDDLSVCELFDWPDDGMPDGVSRREVRHRQPAVD